MFTRLTLLIACLLASPAHANEAMCSESNYDSSTGIFTICGIAESGNKSEARKAALENAKDEFALLCDNTSGCNKNFASLASSKNSCINNDSTYTCYRLLTYSIPTSNTKQSNRPSTAADQSRHSQPTSSIPNRGAGPRLGFFSSMYSITVSHDDANGKELRSDRYSGGAFGFQYSSNNDWAQRFLTYNLVHQPSREFTTTQNLLYDIALTGTTVKGLKYEVLYGHNMSQRGWTYYFGLGIYREMWSNYFGYEIGQLGAELLFGGGYRFNNFYVTFGGGIGRNSDLHNRAIKDYFPETDRTSNIASSLEFGYLFP